MSDYQADDNGLRVVLDTNVLIDSVQDPFSAPAQLIEATQKGQVHGIATSATVQEYRKIIRRLVVQEEERTKLLTFIDSLMLVTPKRVDITIDDEEDYKFLQAAASGQAHFLISSDRHLLDIGELGTCRIVRPTEALAALEEEGGGEWAGWVEGLGIK